jgi:hypothetical protein
MRKEFEKLGYTTKYLKAAWIIMFVCHATLLIMGAAVHVTLLNNCHQILGLKHRRFFKDSDYL